MVENDILDLLKVGLGVNYLAKRDPRDVCTILPNQSIDHKPIIQKNSDQTMKNTTHKSKQVASNTLVPTQMRI
jgi:hypothetical protein